MQELDTFSETESLDFLERTLGHEETIGARKALANILGHLALALKLATSYININDLNISKYLHEIEDILSHESMQAEWFKGLDITKSFRLGSQISSRHATLSSHVTKSIEYR